jgi:glycosyltransferase involved in cell wall biosynthesis
MGNVARMSTSYALVTPARDEAANITRTIESVLAQSIPPRRWVIVDDGSVDGTADILTDAAQSEPRLTVVHRQPGGPEDFASKVRAFAAGAAALAETPFDFIGNLDADMSVPPHYFEALLERFAARPELGLAGGVVVIEDDGRTHVQRTAPNSVAGAVQFFRRACYDDVGGLLPLRLGGEDAAAEIMARLRGWQVETFFDLEARHHGPVHNRKRTASAAWFARGKVNHSLGYDPIFQVFVSGYRLADRPYVLGGSLMLAGYIAAVARRAERALPPEAVSFLRREQRDRLRRLAGRSPSTRPSR